MSSMYGIKRKTYSNRRTTPWVLQFLSAVSPTCYEMTDSLEEARKKLSIIVDTFGKTNVRRYKHIVSLCTIAKPKLLPYSLVIESQQGSPIVRFDIKNSEKY